jgi:hypothetical protein
MNFREIAKWRYSIPFEPFRMTLVNGTTYEIHRPELLVVGKTFTHVGIPESDSSPLVERLIRIPNDEIVRVTEIQKSGTSVMQ